MMTADNNEESLRLLAAVAIVIVTFQWAMDEQ